MSGKQCCMFHPCGFLHIYAMVGYHPPSHPFNEFEAVLRLLSWKYRLFNTPRFCIKPANMYVFVINSGTLLEIVVVWYSYMKCGCKWIYDDVNTQHSEDVFYVGMVCTPRRLFMVYSVVLVIVLVWCVYKKVFAIFNIFNPLKRGGLLRK